MAMGSNLSLKLRLYDIEGAGRDAGYQASSCAGCTHSIPVSLVRNIAGTPARTDHAVCSPLRPAFGHDSSPHRRGSTQAQHWLGGDARDTVEVGPNAGCSESWGASTACAQIDVICQAFTCARGRCLELDTAVVVMNLETVQWRWLVCATSFT